MANFNNMKNQKPDKKKGDEKEPLGFKGSGKTIIFWLVLFLIIWIGFTFISDLNQDAAEITDTEFIQELDNENLIEVTFEDRKVTGVLIEARAFASTNSSSTFSKFTTQIPFPDYNYELVSKIEATETITLFADVSFGEVDDGFLNGDVDIEDEAAVQVCAKMADEDRVAIGGDVKFL